MPGRRILLAVIALLLGSPCCAQPEADRFAPAGIAEAAARSMLEALQSGVRSDDRAKVADLIEYPLRVNNSHTHRLISDRGEFLSNYTKVFTSEIRQQVLEQSFDDLFVSWRGVMIANGAVWFSGVCDAASTPGTCKHPRVRVIAVNLDAPR